MPPSNASSTTPPSNASSTISPTGAQPKNKNPIADAGIDQIVEPGDIVTLDGTKSSDPDGDILSYTWMDAGGNDDSISHGACIGLPADESQEQITAPIVKKDTIIMCKLMVTDSKGASDTDTVQVTVKGNGGGEQGVQEELPTQQGQGTGNTEKECPKGQGPDPDTGECVALPS
jgi:hypothetical protein